MPIRLWIALPGPAVWTPDRSLNRAPTRRQLESG